MDVLSSLADRYRLVVASGTPLRLLGYLLQDIKPYFARIFSSTSHYRQVKTPDFYLKICGEMGVEPGQVIHVGDSWQFDFLNAQQAGMNALYVDRSGANHQNSVADLTGLKDLLVTTV
jgi:putative hydrolase of the HAD superfamily